MKVKILSQNLQGANNALSLIKLGTITNILGPNGIFFAFKSISLEGKNFKTLAPKFREPPLFLVVKQLGL